MHLEVLAAAVLIFVARVVDVSFGTLRTAYVVRGKRAFAFAFGFVEVLVWVAVVAKVIANVNHPIYYVAFAFGFATGTVVGITVEGWFAVGDQVVRVFTPTAASLASAIRERGFRFTEFSGTGSSGPVSLLFIQVPRRRTDAVIEIVRGLDPSCFYTVDDVRRVSSVSATRRQVSQDHLV
jgi:uncharacterized protein YebE (UPF0316 family)